jgi:hypothetical protein
MRYLFSSFFWYGKVPFTQVGEEITALENFHDNVNVVLVLKHIVEPYDIWMLADFQHFDFSLQQL